MPKYKASKIKKESDAKQQSYYLQRGTIAKEAIKTINRLQVKTEKLNYLLKN